MICTGVFYVFRVKRQTNKGFRRFYHLKIKKKKEVNGK